MNELRDLYQQLILDHGRHPRNKRVMEHPTYSQVGNNRLCGDSLIIYVREEKGVIKELSFEGVGCAISLASASLMTESLKGKTEDEVKRIFSQFLEMMTQEGKAGETTLGKLTVLEGVRDFPVRVKCATLCWRALEAALAGKEHTEVTTE